MNYSQIMVSFFGSTTPDLFFALGKFHREIIDLASVYHWQRAVLPLAHDYYTSITNFSATSVQLWKYLSAEWQDIVTHLQSPVYFLKNDNDLDLSKRRYLTKFLGSLSLRHPPITSQYSVTTSIQTDGCTFSNCRRAHQCKACGSQHRDKARCTDQSDTNKKSKQEPVASNHQLLALHKTPKGSRI